ncbi:uncharacterized protein LOC124619777 [Schistocerca americana]|uniref:uncharacterized protein LOC124619777 n=1 Tax=Schistocerca americana TaxID=7009 RepID=UPI001F4F25BE|nr:uncharacterized protein LOC124619777 [Schistocerca americana]
MASFCSKKQWCVFFVCAFIGLVPRGVACLKDVRLRVEPAAVQRGKPASLLCEYDLEGAPLYSVKWYRGQLEFYRYSPSETPVCKIFPFPGIDVDLSSSNATQVVLRRVGFSLSGNFSCEVTADAPSFSTKTVTANMLVVSLPEGPPTLVAERERYYPGDLLRANCTAPPSRPAAQLSFYINDEPVSGNGWRVLSADSLQTSVMSLSVRLRSAHFSDPAGVFAAPGGRLSATLTCRAELAGIYQQEAALQLAPPPPAQAEPVPQRVTSSGTTRPGSLLPLAGAALFCVWVAMTGASSGHDCSR